MNTGESLITIAAMLLLALTVLRVNSNILGTDTVLMDTKFGVLAVSLATSIIEEANKKSFDQADTADAVNDVNLLTAPASLGPSAGEVYPNFDDFDDFNGFKDTVTNLPSAVFNVSCQVCYINPTNPDVVSGSRTWHKKITVFVTSPSMTDTFKLASIYSYWYFR